MNYFGPAYGNIWR